MLIRSKRYPLAPEPRRSTHHVGDRLVSIERDSGIVGGELRRCAGDSGFRRGSWDAPSSFAQRYEVSIGGL